MKRYLLILCLVLIQTSPMTSEENYHSEVLITIIPHIGESYEEVFQEYTLKELSKSNLSNFKTHIIYTNLLNLRVFDDAGDLEFDFGEPILFGVRRYISLNIHLRENMGEEYKFTVSYLRRTYATGTVLTGEYWFYVKKDTDKLQVRYIIPLTGIVLKGNYSPEPKVFEKEGETHFLFDVEGEDMTKITLEYGPREEIDYADIEQTTERLTVKGVEYSFNLKYPKDAQVLGEDLRFFVKEMFPVLIEETNVHFPNPSFSISLIEKGSVEWAAAHNMGHGRVEVFISDPHAYPSIYLTHELVHSYLSGIPLFLNEGLADYFEGRVLAHFQNQSIKILSEIKAEEWYFMTYERQYNEIVDVTSATYGSGATDKKEALIRSKYDKGDYVIHQIALKGGHQAVQNFLKAIVEAKLSEWNEYEGGKDLTLNEVIRKLTEINPKDAEIVFEVLKEYGFAISAPEKQDALEHLEEARGDSWWSRFYLTLLNFSEKIESASFSELEEIQREIEDEREFAERTFLYANLSVLSMLIVTGYLFFRKLIEFGERGRRREREKISTEDVLKIKEALVKKYGSMMAYQAEIASKYGWENVEDEETVKEFARNVGVLE